jgi:Ca-activated chloride channel family protein
MASPFRAVSECRPTKLVTFSIFALAAIAAAAQQPAQNLVEVNTVTTAAGDEFKIVRRVDEVNLRFTVTDGGGHFKNKLSATDFELFDNHQPPAGLHFFQQQNTLPMRVGILIDVSASVAGQFNFEQKAVRVFLEKVMRPGVDEAFVVSFDNNVHLLQDWTSDPKSALRQVRGLHAGGETALYDAVVYAAEKLRRRTTDQVTRPVIILITDGDSNSGKALMYDAQQAATRAEAILFALSTNRPQADYYPRGEAVLELLSRSTGGSILPAHENSQLRHAFQQVEEALRSEYIVGYQPAALKLDGSFRLVEIRPRKSGLRVHSRRGYYAPLESKLQPTF